MRASIVAACSGGFLVIVACTGGGGTVGENGSSSGASSSGGGSSSGASSGSSGGSSSGGSNACTEFVAGGVVDPAIGGSATSRVIVQSVADYGGAAAQRVAALTAACKSIAVALDAPASDQSAAEAQPDARAKLKAWCALAVSAIGTTKAAAGGTLGVQSDPATCGFAVQLKAECQGRCTGGAACDTTANPMTCAGGELSNGLCHGGRLEGGCAVDARCDSGCDVSVASKASCPTPAVAVTSTGAADPTSASKLEAALEAELPNVLALHAHCDAQADVASAFASNASSVSDIEAACIPPVIAATQKAVEDVKACLQSAESLLSSAL